ncbi:MAG: N-acetylneuraminate synthase family protein [Nitrosopumilus sp.]|jgi:sialic acid synthase SpsE|uniref:PseI/NeuA/B-like domain-containing protein n=1 Tax=marine metagenome TaxID=408172 RepID=A0A382E276_9ZZZZ|nr:N-acetylneuraminate synthase family protein [Nitrosopumilus sp.]
MKVFITAEIGSNWEGNYAKAKKIIRECKKAGVDAVKFQMWKAEELYNKSHPNWNEIKRSELSFQMAKKLKEFSDKQKIEFFCSAFYPDGVKFLISIGVKKFKIASRTCMLTDPNSLEVLQEKARSKKEIFISMGMGGNKKKISKIFENNKTTFCYCISDYPLNFDKINWIDAVKYDGFSDHTMDIVAPILFTLLKKQKKSRKIYIEKHVKMINSGGPDASTSISTEKLSEMVKRIRMIEKM